MSDVSVSAVERKPLTKRASRVEAVSKALVVGHLDGVLSMKDTLLAFDPDDLDRLVTVFTATKAAGNGCCTGG